MLTACSVAEPAAGETAWVSGTTYAVGDVRIYAPTHRKYKRLVAGAGTVTPDIDTTNWQDIGPTTKWAAFDQYRSTAITSSATLTMTVRPGIITGMAFFGLVGDTIRVVCKNAASLAVYYDQTYSLSQYLSGDLMWEFYYGTPRQQDVLRISGLYPQDAQVEITLTVSPTTGTAAIGIFALGQFQDIGDPQYGFKAQPVDYSRVTIDADGNATIIKGLAAKNLTGDCLMRSLRDAQAAADVVYRLLGTPCAWTMSDDPSYDYLSAFGLGSAEITSSGPTFATLSLTVQGLI
jgi:hypothetical protein